MVGGEVTVSSSVSDPVPQVSKSSAPALEADQSIDEILGLEVL